MKGAKALSKTSPSDSGGIASNSDPVLTHEDLELEDDERLLEEEEEEQEPKLGSYDELLESEPVPSLSDAS